MCFSKLSFKYHAVIVKKFDVILSQSEVKGSILTGQKFEASRRSDCCPRFLALSFAMNLYRFLIGAVDSLGLSWLAEGVIIFLAWANWKLLWAVVIHFYPGLKVQAKLRLRVKCLLPCVLRCQDGGTGICNIFTNLISVTCGINICLHLWETKMKKILKWYK